MTRSWGPATPDDYSPPLPRALWLGLCALGLACCGITVAIGGLR